jgi:hypothetical protein
MSAENMPIRASTARLRSADRILLKLRASFAFEAAEHSIEIEELSSRGCSGSTTAAVPDGAFVDLKLPGGEPMAVLVKWRRARKIGLEFVRPLKWSGLIKVISHSPDAVAAGGDECASPWASPNIGDPA